MPQSLVTHYPGQGPIINPDLPVIDCKLSNWSPWSTCSAVCGNGRRTRSRYVIQMPQNGGKPCDKKLTRTQRCKDLPPCPQDYSQQVGSKGIRHNSNHQLKSLQVTRNDIHRTTTTTTTPASSMMDDEDESKFSRLLKSELGHLQLNSWTPTESYISDGIIASTEMELIGSSSFQIKNGFIYPFSERNRRQMI